MMLFLIVGSTGSGKTTLIRKLVSDFGTKTISSFPSCTTRQKREGEQNGKDYFFLDKETFLLYAKKNDIIEVMENYGNLYGSRIDTILDVAEHSKAVIKDFDVEGYKTAMERIYDCLEERNLVLFPLVSILIDADDKTLADRMRSRNDNTNVEEREKALLKDRIIKRSNKYDHIIDTTNMTIDESFNALCSVINEEYQKYYDKPLLDKNTQASSNEKI